MNIPIDRFEDFACCLPEIGAILGFDVGSSRIGVSISDGERIVASPLLAMKRGRFRDTAREIEVLCDERSVRGLIVGLPLNMNGSEGPRCQAARAFATNLAARLELPTSYWDERLSTVEAERSMIEGGMSRQRRQQVVDRVAAAIFLQTALDYLRTSTGRPA